MNRTALALGIAGVAIGASGQVSQVSAYRSLWSVYHHGDVGDFETFDETWDFGEWTSYGDGVSHFSDVAPGLLVAELSAHAWQSQEPGRPGEWGRTTLEYSFGLDSPTLWAWGYHLTAEQDVAQLHAGACSFFVRSGPSVHWGGSAVSNEFEDVMVVAGRGFTVLGPGVYDVEAEADATDIGTPVPGVTEVSGVVDASMRAVHTGEPAPTDLGYRAFPGGVPIDTTGSDFEMEIAVYDTRGSVVDRYTGPPGWFGPSLGPGWYAVAVSGDGAVFGGDFGFTPGAIGGRIELEVNGHAVDPTTLEPGEVQLHAFGVTREPPHDDLGVLEPGGNTEITVVATQWSGDHNHAVLYDGYGNVLGSHAFVDWLSLSVPLEPGAYHLAIGPGTLVYGPGFSMTPDWDDPTSCTGTIVFVGSIADEPIEGDAQYSVEYGDEFLDPAVFRFEIEPPPGCNPADLAQPWGLHDLADVAVFVVAFISGDSLADLDRSGLLDLADVVVFVGAFNAGCP
jgi:hypothetical protein